jgi:2-C-methyl-D-erythritol 4-phosphate cytidylyltransferase
MKKYALIVAGGSGTRMGTELPKQFLPLKGKPVLMHTLEKFTDCSIILVLPENQFKYWQELCVSHTFQISHSLCAGGTTRFESVKNGLACITEPDAIVAIHDGVRPLVHASTIAQSFIIAAEKGNAVAAVELKDSIREWTNEGTTRHVNRTHYLLVQTPQTFLVKQIKDAYARATHQNFTDDAGVLESVGSSIHIIKGSYDNIKITTPEDLLMAAALLPV